MRRQRKMTQVKEQIQTRQNGDEQFIDAKFKTLVIRMLKELSEYLKSMKKTHAEMMDILMEIKNNLQGNNSRMDESENQSNDLEYKEAKYNQSEQEEKRIQKHEGNTSSLQDNFKRSNICIIGVPGERARN